MARYLSVTQWLRWTLSYPMLALVVKLPNGYVGRQASQLRLRSVHRPSQQLGASMFWVTPPIVSLIAGRLPTTWRSSGAVQVVLKGDANPSYREGGLIREGNTSANAIADSNNEAIPRTSVPHSRSRPNRWPFSFSCSLPRTGWDAKR